MVLSMLSTIQAVKLQSAAANSTPPPPPPPPPAPAAPPPVEPPSPPDGGNDGGGASSGNPQHPSDMSRRKQKNPKPFFTSSADQEGDNEDGEGALAVDEESAENRSRSAGSAPTSPEPQDLSGMIKVEVREGNFEVNINSSNASSPMEASPTGARVSQIETAARLPVSFSPSPPSTSIGLTAAPSLPQLTPMPPLLRAKQASGPSAPHPVLPQSPTPPGVPSLPVMEEMMIKNNFFHFGDVSVVNHPDAPPVPMVLPMAYLLPIPSAKDFRYRMFVPMNEPPAMPPPIPHPSLPERPVNGSGASLPPRKRKSSGEETAAAQPATKKDQRPLDLSKGSEDEDEEEAASAISAAGVAKKQMQQQQQLEIEASLNFLKAKHMEMLKQQQAMPPQPQVKLPSAESRCEECNINFSKYQNYVAHKKYYCSAGSGGGGGGHKQTKEGDVSKSGGVNRRNTNSKSPGAMSSVNAAKNNEGRANSALSSSPSPDSASAAVAAAAAAATAALQGILGMGSPETRGGPEAGNFTKEMLLLKQQQEELLLKTAKPPPPQLLLPPPMASSGSQPSPTQRTSPQSASTPGPVSPVTITGGPLPPPPPLPQSPSIKIDSVNHLSHFVCDGCGIKFKSVTNLQAHQARYCAGLRNSKPPQPPVDEMSAAFEAMIKRQSSAAAAAAAAAAATSQPPSQPPPPPPQLPLSLTSAAEMMSFLNAKSLEQQAKAAAAALQQAAAVSAALSASGQKVKSPPAAAGGKNRSGSPNNPMAADGFCCILCGYKEQSVEKLKDHINMHFIGQVKKSPGGTLSTEHPEVQPASGGRDSASPGSRIVSSPSPNLSGRRRRKSEDERSAADNITVSPGPESKRLKMEPAERTPTPPPHPPPSSRSPPLLIPSPLAMAAAAARSSPPSVAAASSDPFRCNPCDIGFAHLSNFVAHKKYYCRGKVAGDGGGDSVSDVANGSLVSPKTEK